MLEIILETIKVIILMIGVIMIYDARSITKKVFSFGDQNEAVMTLKIEVYPVDSERICLLTLRLNNCASWFAYSKSKSG